MRLKVTNWKTVLWEEDGAKVEFRFQKIYGSKILKFFEEDPKKWFQDLYESIY